MSIRKKDPPPIHSIFRILSEVYPDERSLLDFRSSFELLIAVILSAQTTDAMVNKVTPELFRRFPSPESLAEASLPELEVLIRPVGYYRGKARHIRDASAVLSGKFLGRVPDRMEDLLLLPGVGRKSANVILYHVYGKPAIIVDTHFGRVVRRLSLTAETHPAKVEKELEEKVPAEIRSSFSMRVNLHGRRYCTARKPSCPACPLKELCLFSEKSVQLIAIFLNPVYSLYMEFKDCCSDEFINECSQKLKVCGHPVRLKLLCMIEKQEDPCVSELWVCLKQPQPVISQHLAVLKDKGIVQSVVQGNKRIYSIVDPFVERIIQSMMAKPE